MFARLIAQDWHFDLYGIRIDEASGFVKCYSNSCPHSVHIFSEKHRKTWQKEETDRKRPCGKSLVAQGLRGKFDKTWKDIKNQKGHGQQPHGRRDRGRGCCGGGGCEVISFYTKNIPRQSVGGCFSMRAQARQHLPNQLHSSFSREAQSKLHIL